jgi:glutamate N-acetyltransferase/amino-acid N-acetyltransferase
MSSEIPVGFSLTGLSCGIKRDKSKRDLSLIAADRPCTAAGVYTQNQVVAAPVILNRQLTPSASMRAIVANSGNANACTGERGLRDAQQMKELVARELGCQADEVLVLSTGIIGEHMPMEKVAEGISRAAKQLAQSSESVVAAAQGLLTTDTRHKLVSTTFSCGQHQYRLLGLAKGAAMIGPKMATMLGILLTDAPLDPSDAQSALAAAVADSFNCISVEGHMSTNDTVLLLASGGGGGEMLRGKELDAFSKELNEACVRLAREIPDDGEGATHLIEIHVTECQTRVDAERIAQSIANSALVKTAVAGADPNWGRIVSAAGYAGVPFDPQTVELHVNGFPLYRHGQPLPFDAEQVSESIRTHRLTEIRFSLGQGKHAIRFWTCDLTAEYVHLNADYHT